MKTLGLDLSTTVCGFSIIENKSILHAGFFDISKAKTYKDKANIIINGLVDKPLIDRIIIEESLSGFAFGKTSQQTILMLAKNKAVISYILGEYYKVPVFYQNASTMRKQLFGIACIRGTDPKQFVKQKLSELYDISKWDIKNKIGNLDKRMNDVYDAIVAGCYDPQ